MQERKSGWLQDELRAASQRVDGWPEWKKGSQVRLGSTESGSESECDSDQTEANSQDDE